MVIAGFVVGLVERGVSSSVSEAHESWEWRRTLGSLSVVFLITVLGGVMLSESNEDLRSGIGDDGGEVEVRLGGTCVSLDPVLAAEARDDCGLGGGARVSSRSMSRSDTWLVRRTGSWMGAGGGVNRSAVVCLGDGFLLRIPRGCCTLSLSRSYSSVFFVLNVEGSGNTLASGIAPVCSASSFPASLRCIQVGGLATMADFSFHHLGMPLTNPSSRSFSTLGISCLNLHPIAVQSHSPVLIQCVQCSFLDGSGSMPDG